MLLKRHETILEFLEALEQAGAIIQDIVVVIERGEGKKVVPLTPESVSEIGAFFLFALFAKVSDALAEEVERAQFDKKLAQGLGLSIGDKVTVNIEPVKSGAPVGRVLDVTFPDGKVLSTGGAVPAPLSK